MAKMPPPERGKGMAIVIAAHPAGPSKGGKMPPPGMSDDAMPPDPAAAPDDAGAEKDKDGKISPDAAGVIRDDQHCVNCKNYDANSGMCSKVSGSFSPDDACVQYFEAMQDDDDSEPDADDQDGAPDNDEDDQGAPPPAAA